MVQVVGIDWQIGTGNLKQLEWELELDLLIETGTISTTWEPESCHEANFVITDGTSGY